jgi:hypothetical protein
MMWWKQTCCYEVGPKGELRNVGTGVSTSFNELVRMLNEGLGTSIKPLYVPNPIKNYAMHMMADIE